MGGCASTPRNLKKEMAAPTFEPPREETVVENIDHQEEVKVAPAEDKTEEAADANTDHNKKETLPTTNEEEKESAKGLKPEEGKIGEVASDSRIEEPPAFEAPAEAGKEVKKAE